MLRPAYLSKSLKNDAHIKLEMKNSLHGSSEQLSPNCSKMSLGSRSSANSKLQPTSPLLQANKTIKDPGKSQMKNKSSQQDDFGDSGRGMQIRPLDYVVRENHNTSRQKVSMDISEEVIAQHPQDAYKLHQARLQRYARQRRASSRQPILSLLTADGLDEAQIKPGPRSCPSSPLSRDSSWYTGTESSRRSVVDLLKIESPVEWSAQNQVYSGRPASAFEKRETSQHQSAKRTRPKTSGNTDTKREVLQSPVIQVFAAEIGDNENKKFPQLVLGSPTNRSNPEHLCSPLLALKGDTHIGRKGLERPFFHSQQNGRDKPQTWHPCPSPGSPNRVAPPAPTSPGDVPGGGPGAVPPSQAGLTEAGSVGSDAATAAGDEVAQKKKGRDYSLPKPAYYNYGEAPPPWITHQQRARRARSAELRKRRAQARQLADTTIHQIPPQPGTNTNSFAASQSMTVVHHPVQGRSARRSSPQQDCGQSSPITTSERDLTKGSQETLKRCNSQPRSFPPQPNLSSTENQQDLLSSQRGRTPCQKGQGKPSSSPLTPKDSVHEPALHWEGASSIGPTRSSSPRHNIYLPGAQKETPSHQKQHNDTFGQSLTSTPPSNKSLQRKSYNKLQVFRHGLK